jgi:hypothetical protein
MSPYRSPPETNRAQFWQYFSDWLEGLGPDPGCPSPNEMAQAAAYAKLCVAEDSVTLGSQDPFPV